MTTKRTFAVLIALTLTLLGGHAGAESGNTNAPSHRLGVRSQYLTTQGTFTLEVPKGYVGLSQVDPDYFNVFVAQHGSRLRLVEVFVSAEDWHATRQNHVLFRDQLIMLQLPAQDGPLVDGSAWEKICSEMYETMASKQVAKWISDAEEPAVKRFNDVHNAEIVKRLSIGEIVVYHQGGSDFRWMTKGNAALQSASGPSSYTALMTIALVRNHGRLVFLQSVIQESSSVDFTEALKKFDVWVGALK